MRLLTAMEVLVKMNNYTMGSVRLAAWIIIAAASVLGMHIETRAQTAGGSAGTGILFILDGSGSMAAQIDGKPKMDVAKEVMVDLIDGLPDNVKVGLEVYGHRSKGDCNDIETLAEVGAVDKKTLIEKINSIKPMGKTPITKSFEIAGQKLAAMEEETTVILVSDGEETCEGDPCALVKSLKEQGIKVKVHVVGFDVGAKEKEQLSCIAEAGGGRYFAADNAQQLQEALAEVQEEVAKKPAPAKMKTLPPGGDRPESAVPVEPGDYVTGHAIAKDVREYYSIKLKPGQTLSVGTRTPDTSNPYSGVGIYNEEGNLVVEEKIIGDAGVLKTVSWMVGSGKDEYTYYWSAGNEYDPTPEGTAYYIKVADNFDIGSQTDAGDSLDDTMDIKPGSYTGYLSGTWGSDKKDYYTIPLGTEQKLGVKLTPKTDTGFRITIFDQDRVQVAQKASANAGAIARLTWTAPEEQEVVYVLIEPDTHPDKTAGIDYNFDLKVE